MRSCLAGLRGPAPVQVLSYSRPLASKSITVYPKVKMDDRYGGYPEDVGYSEDDPGPYDPDYSEDHGEDYRQDYRQEYRQMTTLSIHEE